LKRSGELKGRGRGSRSIRSRVKVEVKVSGVKTHVKIVDM